MKKKVIKIISLLLAVVVIGIIFWIVRHLIIDIIKYAKENNQEAIKELIADKGIFSYLSIVIVEAIQMIIIVIPAEFIQLAAGISFPAPIAIGLCLAGVTLGATIIYLLVKVFKFDRTMLGNNSRRIDELASKKNNMSIQAIMYVLFITPIIPFGAICYFGASKNISYRRYILTCATGVIPSILSSILLGNGMVYLTSLGVPLWAIILIIIFLMIVLFFGLMLFIKKKYFNGSIGSPKSNLYPVLLKIFARIVKIKANVKFKKKEINKIDGPVVFIANHGSFFDMYYACQYLYPKRGAIIGNRFYLRGKLASRITKQIGVIPKKLFVADLETIKMTLKSAKEGNSIILFPEGRLSVDGTQYPIVAGTGSLIRKLGIPLVIVNIRGAYLTNPKWRKKRMRGNVTVKTQAILMPDALKEMTTEQIDNFINDNLQVNDFEYAREKNLIYKGKNKSKGLENILHICPHCKKEFTLETTHNTIKCSNCHNQFTINDNYSFDKNDLNITDIHHFYQLNKEYQKEQLTDNFCLETEVKVKKLDLTNKKNDKSGSGKCILTKETFEFVGTIVEEAVEFKIPIKVLKALAFSCGEEFECYYNDYLYYFYPHNGKECVKWAMIVDILNEETNEK